MRPDGSVILALWGLILPRCSRDPQVGPAKPSKIFIGDFLNIVTGLLASFPDSLMSVFGLWIMILCQNVLVPSVLTALAVISLGFELCIQKSDKLIKVVCKERKTTVVLAVN